MDILKEILSYVIIILIVIIIRTFIISPVRVDGASMETTLYNGDILFMEKIVPNYKRFDIIVTTYDNQKLIKRIVGLPGEKVEYKDSKLYINDKEIAEPFTTEPTNDFSLSKLGYDVIPEGHYFIMGDNRNNSVDSRLIGLVKKENLMGRTRLCIYPFNHFGLK